MTLEQLQQAREQFINAIKEYKNGKDYDEIDLERVLDDTLCRLPRDIIYIEWFDRSDIEYRARQIRDNDRTGDKITDCMYELWNYNDNIMDNEIVDDIVNATITGEQR